MQNNDGGKFNNPFLQLLAARNGGSLSEDEILENEKLHQDAINAGMGSTGSLKLVGALEQAAPQVEMGLAEQIQKAVQNSKVKGPEGGLTNNASMYQKGSAFEKGAKERFAEIIKNLRK